MKKVAFFDIDGTLFRSSLFIEVVDACIEVDVLPRVIRDDYMDAYLAWVERTGSYESYLKSMIASFSKHIRGVHYGDFVEIGTRVVETQGKRVYRYTRDLVSDLRGKGYTIVAISQSPKCILDVFCAGYGFHKVYGRVYEIGPRDCFTGNVIDEALIADKARIVARVLERDGFSFEGSMGVGDTESDIPLLSAVEMPICFNPNQSLYAHAKSKGWPIVVERKDVVYTI